MSSHIGSFTYPLYRMHLFNRWNILSIIATIIIERKKKIRTHFLSRYPMPEPQTETTNLLLDKVKLFICPILAVSRLLFIAFEIFFHTIAVVVTVAWNFSIWSIHFQLLLRAFICMCRYDAWAYTQKVGWNASSFWFTYSYNVATTTWDESCFCIRTGTWQKKKTRSKKFYARILSQQHTVCI